MTKTRPRRRWLLLAGLLAAVVVIAPRVWTNCATFALAAKQSEAKSTLQCLADADAWCVGDEWRGPDDDSAPCASEVCRVENPRYRYRRARLADGREAVIAHGQRESVYGDLWLLLEGEPPINCYSVRAEHRHIGHLPGWATGAGAVQDPRPECTEVLLVASGLSP